jgi:hypothetical protein
MDSIFLCNTASNDLLKYNGGTINNYAGYYQLMSNSILGNIGSALHVCNFIPEGGILAGLPSFTYYMDGNTYFTYLEPLELEILPAGLFKVNTTNNWWGSNSNLKEF